MSTVFDLNPRLFVDTAFCCSLMINSRKLSLSREVDLNYKRVALKDFDLNNFFIVKLLPNFPCSPVNKLQKPFKHFTLEWRNFRFMKFVKRNAKTKIYKRRYWSEKETNQLINLSVGIFTFTEKVNSCGSVSGKKCFIRKGVKSTTLIVDAVNNDVTSKKWRQEINYTFICDILIILLFIISIYLELSTGQSYILYKLDGLQLIKIFCLIRNQKFIFSKIVDFNN